MSPACHPRPAVALVVALLAGCTVDRLPETDAGVAPGGTSGVAPGVASGAEPALAGSPAAVPPPAVGEVPPVSPDPAAADPTPTSRAANLPLDSAAVTASPTELRELAAAMVIPVQGLRAADLHDSYAERRGGGSRPHEALDILAPRGTPVLSATGGILRKKHASIPGGLMIYAGDATDRFVLMYGHLDRYADGLVEGQVLARGQVIGYVGTTGNAAPGTPHLHFAIARGTPSRAWWRGTPVNPYPLLAGAPGGGTRTP